MSGSTEWFTMRICIAGRHNDVNDLNAERVAVFKNAVYIENVESDLYHTIHRCGTVPGSTCFS